MLTNTLERSQRAPLATAPATTAALSAGASTPSGRAVAGVLSAFRRHGGLARGDDIADRLRQLHGTNLSALARRIVARELICFEWHGELWLPLLQFDWVDMSLQPAIRQVAAELAGVFDAWEVCCWLAAPNSSLGDRAPLDVLESDPIAVLQVAREDRFVARG